MNKILFFISCCIVSFLSHSEAAAQAPCVTGSSVASEGSFSVGYTITYETLTGGGASNRDVKITIELLDTDKLGLVAYLKLNDSPNFTEQNFDSSSGQVYTKTLTGLGLTDGATISYGCKFAYAGGLSVTDYIDYEVGFDCSGTNDVISPDSFTAIVGAITPFSVEFLLNANDASGTVVYDVTYNGITETTSATAGVQKSFVVSGLTSNTDYNFNVIASDLAGNMAANNPIPLAATTTMDISTACAGTSIEAEQGVFDVGYNYTFETLPNGTDVKFTFELLDNKIGVVAYLWRTPPDFLETQMNLVSGQTFTLTVPQTPGATITYACKFAFQGGLSVTKYFNYDVGDDCILGVEGDLPYDFGTILAPTTHGIIPDPGDPSNIVTNEVDPDDSNNSVLQIIGGGAQWDNAQVTFTTPIDLSDNENNLIRLKFRDMTSTSFPSTHALKFEGGAGGPATTELTFTANDNAWHTIDLDFPGGLGTFTKMVIFTDYGVAGPTGTYLIDDIEHTGAPCVSPVLSATPIDFSSPEDAAFTTGDLASIAIIDDGGNDVLELVGADNNWDNAQVTFCAPQDLSDDANNTIRFKMKSTTAGVGEVHQHGLKFEGGAGVPPITEFNFNTTGNDWNNIEIDFPAGLGSFPKMVIFADCPQLGSVAPIDNHEIGTYLIDDITLGATILGVEDFKIKDFSVYPNPTQDSWTVKSKNQNILTVSVFNILGKKVMSLFPNDNKAEVDGRNLNSGLYFAQVKTAHGISSIKLIKK